MPFIGNQPALSYTSFAKQDFTTSATTSYTLDNPVTNENEIALFINFVRQEPTTAYTASNTTLTLTSATSASDDMYCVFLGKAVQTVNPPSGSVGISQLSATGTKDATTFLRGDNTFASAGGTMTPAFQATAPGDQSYSDAVMTVIPANTEEYDTDSAYNTSNYRFTPQVAGKYFCYIQLTASNDAQNLKRVLTTIRKNGSNNYQDFMMPDTSNNTRKIGVFQGLVLDLNGSTDYFEAAASLDGTSGNNSTDYSRIGAYKIIE